jgi:hypothetical protein
MSRQASLTSVESDFRVAFPIPDGRVLVHQFVDAKDAVSEHASRDTGQVGKLLVRLLNLARPPPYAGWGVYGCKVSVKASSQTAHRLTSKRSVVLQHPTLHRFLHKDEINVCQSPSNLSELRSEPVQRGQDPPSRLWGYARAICRGRGRG